MKDREGRFFSVGREMSPWHGQMFFVQNVCNDRLSPVLSQNLIFDKSKCYL